jgi:hypothetical protein
MTNQRENWVPLGGTSRHYRNAITGQEISRRAFLDIQVRDEGFRDFTDYRKTADTQTAMARGLGFRDMGEVRRLQRNDMYQVFERIRMVKRGGVPIETLQDLSTPEGAEFQAALAAMIRSGEWVPRPPTDEPRGRPNRRYAKGGPNTERFFQLLEIAPQDWQKWIRNMAFY